MMDQTTVHTTVTILERVNIDKTKGSCRRLQNRIQTVIPHSLIGGQHAGTEYFDVFGPRADEFRQGITESKNRCVFVE